MITREKDRRSKDRSREKSTRRTIFIYTVAIVAIVIITAFLPRESKFGYTYEEGRPWHYTSLIANYDFPIRKSEAQLKADQDSAISQFQPYVNFADTVEKQQIQAVNRAVARGEFKGLPAGTASHIMTQLHKVYAQGIISNAEMQKLQAGKFNSVRIVNGKTATSTPTAALLTPRSAYEAIISADTTHYTREQLSQVNFANFLQPSLVYDTVRSKAALKEVLAGISSSVGLVQSGQKIIDRGEIVDKEQYQILKSFQYESELRKDSASNFRYLLTGQFIFVTIVVLLFLLYLRLYRVDILRSPQHLLMLITMMTIFPVLTSLMMQHQFFSVYILPYAMVAIFIRVFMDSRTAVFTYLCTILISALPLHNPFQFVSIELIGGIIAVFSLRELTARSQLFKTAIYITLSAMLMCVAYNFTQGSTENTLDLTTLTHLVICGVILLLAYPMMYIVERLFGFISSVTLVELSNTNSDALRQMSKVAQGTFIHSMQVANLATEVANKIGAKAQLARTGAMYHDIGKMESPVFFTENQSGRNPHDEINEEDSAKIIINHVTKGMELADKYNLPRIIRDFIETHHGHSTVKYFYINACNRLGEDNVDKEKFTYPVRNPFTLEQAIVMMADSVEAASRSLKEYTEESITELVNKIVDGQVQNGYFSNCPITFRDISMAKTVFIESLKTIYHTRIAYPELHEKKKHHTLPTRFGGTFFNRK